jgi:hypothetical protein
MYKKICLPSAILVLMVCSISLSAQTKAKFVSPDGGFTIDLPKEGLQGVDPVGDLNSGAGTYAWMTDNGQFSVSYLENAFPASSANESLKALAAMILKSPINAAAVVVSRRQFEKDGNPTIELRLKRQGGSAINRLIVVKRRLYVLTADWVEGDGAAATSALDSFQLVDGSLLIA